MNLGALFRRKKSEPEPASRDGLKPRHTDTRSPVKIGIWILVIGFGGFMLWASLAPLDEGVPCQGVVSIATKRKVVQHRFGGTVTEVLVQEGQKVGKGDLLMVLDDQTAKARYAEVHQHYLGLRATEARLLAEESGSAKMELHSDLTSDPDSVLVRRLVKTQRELLKSRLQIMSLLRQQLSGMKQLASEGFAPLSQQRDLEIKVVQFRADSEAQLAQVQDEVKADAEKSKALAQELADTRVTSPSDGQVVGLQVQTVGAVIQPGQKLMDIVPFGEPLLIEAKIAPHLIDRVRSGLTVDLHFTAFAHAPQLVIPGTLESVSGDLLTESPSGAQPAISYYLARIAVTPEGMKELGRRRIQAGMPVLAVIKTGERSMLTYILHPLMQRMAASMKEE
ncbi:HlyD family efflux transporter periplasmic adaptor subunit [Chlorobaculum sp. 24CR]|uniref:HlyD family efflux transporter periplasmic adaptor subunit n=1 Tax=Chlorobaculum sp. 24CR TaxID=2508878 RepID=UPI00100A65D2|nr:HlyD family efflux transporter periplasmic adaptor subunit [Chlorobaculum sp. 24CR]RXK88452.1 HlyD family efflux transporter periplasmic adaptor subunit [Chlorobaculum sp. 24CR]